MDWILRHFQIILAVAGAVAYWVNQRRAQQTGGDETEETIAEREAHRRKIHEQIHGRTEDEERTRRVQEEIRRKIAERREGRTVPAGPPPLRSEPPVASPVRAPRPVARPIEKVFRSAPVARPVEPPRESTAAILERQQQLADKMRELETARALAQKRAAQATVVREAATEAAAGTFGPGLREDLRDPLTLRRAFVMREVLDAPVALR